MVSAVTVVPAAQPRRESQGLAATRAMAAPVELETQVATHRSRAVPEALPMVVAAAVLVVTVAPEEIRTAARTVAAAMLAAVAMPVMEATVALVLPAAQQRQMAERAETVAQQVPLESRESRESLVPVVLVERVVPQHRRVLQVTVATVERAVPDLVRPPLRSLVETVATVALAVGHRVGSQAMEAAAVQVALVLLELSVAKHRAKMVRLAVMVAPGVPAEMPYQERPAMVAAVASRALAETVALVPPVTAVTAPMAVMAAQVVPAVRPESADPTETAVLVATLVRRVMVAMVATARSRIQTVAPAVTAAIPELQELVVLQEAVSARLARRESRAPRSPQVATVATVALALMDSRRRPRCRI